MSDNEYHFITNWHFDATVDEVFAILNNPLELVRWWPSVYLDVNELDSGDERHIGRVIDLYTKGWLPYTLRWRFRVDEIVENERLTLSADGDFIGRGVWTLAPGKEGGADVTYDWRLEANKPLLKTLTPVMRPLFENNHVWAMNQGEISLNLELQRRRAETAFTRAQVPPPPPAVPVEPFYIGGAVTVLILLLLLRKRK